jgi:hypothetical protein
MTLCNGLNFEECELHIMRQAVDKIDKVKGKRLINNPDIQTIITIVENFIIDKKLVCYGGTAINNILPKKDQFYNIEAEIPDYDFYSPNALEDAKELALQYYNSGFKEVEAKSGIHHNTYKVFVNFIPVADITYMPKSLFNIVSKKSLKRNNILYAPPNFLRMGMYLELSRPQGDITRWEKVTKRLQLLNKNYPINEDIKCKNDKNKMDSKVKNIIVNTALDEELVFFGLVSLEKYNIYKNSDCIYLLSDDIESDSIEIKNNLEENKIKKCSIKRHYNIGEIIPKHIEIILNNKTVAILFEPLGCHNYNELVVNNKTMKILTIDSMLSFYLAFIYSGRSYFNTSNIICLSDYLYNIQYKNIKNNKGIFKRFSINCYGNQETLETMRAKKAEMYRKLKRGTREFNEWFLRYIPQQEEYKKRKQNKKVKKTKKVKKVKKNKTIKMRD